MISAVITLLAYTCVLAPQDSSFAARSAVSEPPRVQSEDDKAAARKVIEAMKWLDERKPVQALEALNAANKLSPQEIPGEFWMFAYYQSKQFAKVVAWGQTNLYDSKTKELKTGGETSLLIYAASLCEVGEWEEAKEAYAAALPSLNCIDGKPRFAVAQDLSVLNEPFVKDRFRSAIHAALGMDAQYKSSSEIMKYELRESLRLYSRNVCANYYLACHLKNLGDISESEEYMVRAIKYGGKAFADAISSK